MATRGVKPEVLRFSAHTGRVLELRRVGVLLESRDLPKETAISVQIERDGAAAFAGQTTLAELKRPVTELVSYLFRENSFPEGAFLMTGTGIVPNDDFTLAPGDRIVISIDNIGTLENRVSET